MAGSDGDDPFLWEVDRVVQELCTPTRSWPAPPARKLPNPDALEAKLRERDFDGETLLTFGDIFGVLSLWKALGIKKAPHQLSINAALQFFRRRSAGYREWKATQTSTGQSDDDANDSSEEPALSNGISSRFASETLPNGTSSTHVLPSEQTVSAAPLPSKDTLRGEASPPAGSNGIKRTSDDMAAPDLSTADQPGAEAQPLKKRRAVLTNVSANPIHRSGLAIPTEADIFTRVGAVQGTTEKKPSSSAYLGSAVMASRQVATPSDTDLDGMDADSDNFCWVGRRVIPPGRRLQVSKAMKTLLRRGPLNIEMANLDEDEDAVLPAFGDSDDEESIDSKTWEAYEAEQKIIQRRKERAIAPGNQAAEVVDAIIKDLEGRWISTKKPAQDCKARKIWDEARRGASRQQLINSHKMEQQRKEKVISDVRDKIVSMTWKDKFELGEYAKEMLALNISALQKAKWHIALLESPRQPPKLKPAPRAPPRRETIAEGSDGEDEETINSDSEDESEDVDDINDFVIHDDPVSDPMEVDSASDLDQQSRPGSVSPNQADLSEAETENSLPRSPATVKKVKIENAPLPATPRKVLNLAASELIEIESSPIAGPKPTEIPGFDEPDKIEEIGVEHWAKISDADRLVIAVLSSWPWARKTLVFKAVKYHQSDEVWESHVAPYIEKPPRRLDIGVDTPAFGIMRLFDCYISCTADRRDMLLFNRVTLQRISREERKFDKFRDLLLRVIPHFQPPTPQTPTKIRLIRPNTASQETPSRASRDEDEDHSDSMDISKKSGDDKPLSSANKRRRRRPKRDQNAQDLRVTNLEQQEEFEKRRRLLHQQLAQEGEIPSDRTRLIINETKESDQALIYVNEQIGQKIKDHQIDGVRFMWNHVVAKKSKVRQGCLLAHEMGLGKTMQVITLLVAIAEASRSEDPSVSSQIPEDLKSSRTLILCPAGLVDNWVDEILIWAPENLLGQMFKYDSSLSDRNRARMVRDWASKGGILVAGYALFTALIRRNEPEATLVQEAPNIVIADEAHQLKNPDSQRHQAASHFRTMSRIALTGSPLTKHVMDYYAMINWVAPGFLADISEFKNRFENPIKEGLYADSTGYAKRKSRKMLHILKETVGPLVHRRDVQVLRDTLPGKKEFIITLPLTTIQIKAYNTYLEAIQSPQVDMSGQAKVWSFVALLSTLLAHPQIFKTTLEHRMKNLIQGSEDEQHALKSIPIDFLRQTLAQVNGREIGDPAHSNKILILFRILDECKRLGDKVLVFSQSIPTLDYLANAFRQQKRNFQRLDGSTPVGRRQASVKQFNNDDTAEIYLISTGAGGVGLNINGANRVVIFDFKYTPAEEQQAVGRAYRIGQTKPVFVYWLTIGGTFEGAIHNNAVFKTQLASRVVDKKNPDPYSNRRGEYFVTPTIPDQEDLSDAQGKDQVLDVLLNSKDLAGIVRKVTPTETFEKEEIYELPAEDRQDAEQHIAMERLRHENPEEYRRQESMRARGEIATTVSYSAIPPPVPGVSQFLPQVQHPSQVWPQHQAQHQPQVRPQSQVPPAAQLQHQPQVQPATQAPPLPAAKTTQIIIKNSGIRVKSVEPATALQSSPVTAPQDGDLKTAQQDAVPAHASSMTVVQASINSPALSNKPIAQPSPTIPVASSASVRPPATPVLSIPAAPPPGSRSASSSPSPERDLVSPGALAAPTPAFTSFLGPKTQSNSSPVAKQSELEPILASGTHYKDAGKLPPSAANTAQQEARILESLSEASQRLRSAGYTALTHQHLMLKIDSALSRLNCHGLPRMDKLQSLEKCIRRPRFTEALLAGYFKPEEVVTMSRSELNRKIEGLEKLGEAQFKSIVWKPPTSPEPVPKRESLPNRPMMSDTQRTSDRGSEDLRALQEALIEKAANVPVTQNVRIRPPDPQTSGQQRRTIRPGDTAESPHIID